MVGCVDDIAKFKGINLEIIDPGEFVTGGAVVPQEDGKFERILKRSIN